MANTQNVTIKDIVNKYTNLSTDNYIKIFVEIFAIPLAYIFINFTKLTANQVTYLGFTVGFFGSIAACLMANDMILFAVFYFFFVIFGVFRRFLVFFDDFL